MLGACATVWSSRIKEYEIIDTNADNIGGCGICGRKPGRTEGYRRKCDWLKKRYAEGVRFKVLRSRESGGVGVIKYAPGDQAWRPVEAEGYFVIHCLMIIRKHLGLKPKVVRITSAKASRELPTPYGVFSIIHDGRLIAERPISGTRFTNIMTNRGTKRGMPIGVRSARGDSQA